MIVETPTPLPTHLTLSIRQPFAQLVVTESRKKGVPVKWIENRSWEPNVLKSSIQRDGKATILIHASGTAGDPSVFEEFKLDAESTPRSAIIGHVEVVGWQRCIGSNNQTHEGAIWWTKQLYFEATGLRPAKASDQHFADVEGIYWWMLANPMMYRNPILDVKGRLNIWKFEE